MLIEIVNNMPKPLVDYWIENSNKPIDNLQIYTKGFCEGMNFVITFFMFTKSWEAASGAAYMFLVDIWRMLYSAP